MSSPNKTAEEYARMQEERLKDWARKNYVLKDQRKSSWHPIVLEEMARQDAENELLRTQDQGWDEVEAKLQSIVPLMPDQYYTLHQQHTETPAPKFVTQSQKAKTNESDDRGFVETGWY